MTKATVKQRIEKIIELEDPAKPFSDQDIHRLLKTESIKLARRTVTKYREELHIQPARFRKTNFEPQTKNTSQSQTVYPVNTPGAPAIDSVEAEPEALTRPVNADPLPQRSEDPSRRWISTPTT